MVAILVTAVLLTWPARVRQAPPPLPGSPRQQNELTAAGARRVMARMLWAFGVADWQSAPLPELVGDVPDREYRALLPPSAGHDGWKLSIDSVSGALSHFVVVLHAGTPVPTPNGSAKALSTNAQVRERAQDVAARAPLPAGYSFRYTDWDPRKVTFGVDGMPDIASDASHAPAPESTNCEVWFAPDLPGRYPVDRWSTGSAPYAVLKFDAQSGRVTLAAALTHVVVVPRPVRVSGAAARRVADRCAAPFLRHEPDALHYVPKGHDPCTKVALEYAQLRGTVLDEDGLVRGTHISTVGLQTIRLVWTVQYGQLEIWIDPATGEQVGVNL